LDEKTKEQVLADLRTRARPCFQCGICTSSCPVFRVAPELNPRLSVDSIINRGVVPSEGMEWLCAYCLMCDQRCPMDVSLAEILMTIKNISALEGKAPPDVIESAYALLSSGCLTPISSRVEKTRKDLGLPELPKPDIDDVQKIFEQTGAMNALQANKTSEERS
jgi:heterodisulfide reductase subunit C